MRNLTEYTPNVLYIRADANEFIGTGHVMRCLSIAEAWRRTGGDAVFLAADSRTEKIVAKRGFSALCMNAAWNDLENELEALLALIKKDAISLLLVDSYYVTRRYLETLRQHVQLAYIDDLAAFAYPVDLLIHYSVFGEQKDYGRIDFPKLLLGCRYTPLNCRFCGLPRRKIQQQAEKVLVLTGGTDTYHVALKIAEYVLHTDTFRDMRFEIVCGRYNSDYDMLCRLAAGTERIFIRYNVENMAELMLAADLAVTAGGTTAYELCACGTPSVCYILADNQLENMQAFVEAGLMLSGGDVRERCGVREIFKQLERLSRDAVLRAEMARRMQDLVDGEGAERIAGALREICRKRGIKNDSIWTSDH